MENAACRMDGFQPSAYIVHLKTGTSIPINKERLILGRKIEYSKGFSEAVDYYVANRKVSRMPAPAEVPGAVFVDVEAQKESDCRLELTYYNARADWTPFYDIRVSEPEKTVSFTLKGRVRQNTGEEWENVELSLSTGRLSQSNNKPELLPWVLHQKNAYRPMPGMMSQAASPKAMPYDATFMMEDATTILKSDEKNPALSQWKPSPQNKAEQNDISMEYSISDRCSVKSGGAGSIVNVLENSANAEYLYYITPKAECSAFLTAHVQDWEKMDFLEGDANIFMGNRYVGATHINPQNIRDNFQISLGRDRNILVQRKRGTQYRSKSFLGNVSRRDFEYQLWVKNGKDIDIDILVTDQIPTSSDDKIQVDVIDISKAEVEERTGKLTWKCSLKSMEERYFNIVFRVSCAKGCEVDL